MKRLAMALLALVLGGSAAAAKDNYAVETMLQRCELALAVLTRDGTYEQRADAGNCLGFLAGVSRSMTSYAWLADTSDVGVQIPLRFRACIPPGASGQAMVQAFINTARSEPGSWQMGAASVAMSAFATTWPCPAQ